MQTEHYVLTQSPLASLDSWQEAIDAEGWPLRLLGHEGSLLVTAIVRAEIKGLPTEFVLEFQTRQQFAERWNFATVPAAWRHHVRIAERGPSPFGLRVRSGVASVVAACAYGIRTDGVWCVPSTEARNPQDMSAARESLRRNLPAWLEVFIDEPGRGRDAR